MTTYLNFKQMNIPAAKQKIASINKEVKVLDEEEIDNLDKVYAFLTRPAGKLPSSESKSESEGTEDDGYDGVGFINTIGRFPESQRFPRESSVECRT